MSHSNFTFLRS